MSAETVTGPIAVIADIHGNADALKAVLADIDRQGITEIVNLGDCLSAPLAPRETADILMDRPMTTVRGNHDRWLIERPRDQLGTWDGPAFDALETRHFDWLGSLPATTELGADMLLCHATPGDDLTYWLDSVRPDGVVAARPLDQVIDLAGGSRHRVILCGHTHIARAVRIPDGPLIVNPGSVGVQAFDDDKPVAHVVEAGTPDARYAVLERCSDDWQVNFRLVPYDASTMIARAAKQGFDWSTVLTHGRVCV